MKLIMEFHLDEIGTDSAAFEKIQYHAVKILEQIRRYSRGLAEPNCGYSCGDSGESADIVAQWVIQEELSV